MPTKLLGLMTSLCIGFSAMAGTVHRLQPDQTFPLSNGDIVMCDGPGSQIQPPPPPPEAWRCTLMISGLPPYRGKYTAATKAEAKAMAKDVCQSETAGRVFKDFFNQPYNPCDPPASMSGIYLGYSCKNEAQ